MDNKIIINGPDGTIHRATEVSHTSIEVMQMFDAMVACRDQHGGIDILGISLYFVLPMRATEMAAETRGVANVRRPGGICVQLKIMCVCGQWCRVLCCMLAKMLCACMFCVEVRMLKLWKC